MSVTPTVREASASQAVVEAVADAEGVEPVELDVPLFETVDPEALDKFVRSADADGDARLSVAFTYYGHDVVVDADGSVRIPS